MKKTLLLVTFIVGGSYSAWATSCVSGTLTTYEVANFSCTVGDLTYSDFSYLSAADGGAFAPSTDGVTVTPVTSGFGSDTGLVFTAIWAVGTDQSEDSSITYSVESSNPGGITDELLDTVGGAAGEGVATVAETSATGPISLFTEFGPGTDIASDPATVFVPADTPLTVTKDIGVTGGTVAGGGAHLSDVYNLFSQGSTSTVPEPSLVLLCGGLLAFIPIARRKFVR
jgi:hypothetical protein